LMRWETACYGRVIRRYGMPWYGIWNRHQKKALEERNRLGEGHRLIRHCCDYRVDGEIGRFTFALCDVEGSNSGGVIGVIIIGRTIIGDRPRFLIMPLEVGCQP